MAHIDKAFTEMKNRVDQLFEAKGHSILSVYFTAGFPSLEDTIVLAEGLQAAGADMIEIGIPFSDPVADGPVIQASNAAALSNGMTVVKLMEQLHEIRKSVTIPIILMGYLNPVLQYGWDAFCRNAATAGIDGLIIPDLPLDVYAQEYQSAVQANGLKITFLISPTTSAERIHRIDRATEGFIYAVSSSSVTGAKTGFDDDQVSYFKKIKDMKLKNPFLIGFGVSSASTFKSACQHASGAIVGSAFISMIRESKDMKQDILTFIQRLRG